jgi:hypothetical protein
MDKLLITRRTLLKNIFYVGATFSLSSCNVAHMMNTLDDLSREDLETTDDKKTLSINNKTLSWGDEYLTWGV